MTDPDRSPSVETRLDDLERLIAALDERLGILEVVVQTGDASFYRHQDQYETELERLRRTVDRVGEQVNAHEDAHWRSGR